MYYNLSPTCPENVLPQSSCRFVIRRSIEDSVKVTGYLNKLTFYYYEKTMCASSLKVFCPQTYLLKLLPEIENYIKSTRHYFFDLMKTIQ